MKRKMIFILLLLCCFSILCTACTKDEHTCVKCGGTATTTLSGPADIMQKNGISLSDCKQITSNVYTAYVCDSCVGHVVEMTPS